MKKVVFYFKEIWHRLVLKTPSFFKVIQFLSSALAFITGLPDIIIQSKSAIILPHWIIALSNEKVAINSIVALFISSLVVKNPDKLKVKSDGTVTPLLPFTKSNDNMEQPEEIKKN